MTTINNNDIDTETILKEGAFVSGGRGSGKSTLGYWIAEQLISDGVAVKVIDSSLAFVKNSSVPYYQRIRYRYQSVGDLTNGIYDFSRLSCSTMRAFTACLLEDALNVAIEATDNGIAKPQVWIFDEVQNLIPSGALRSTNDTAQSISRYISQGRNFHCGFVALSQRLASVDVNLVEISGLKFFGKTEGQNSLRKIKAWLPKDTVKELRDLQVGQFYKQRGSNIELVTTNKFYTATKPKLYQHHEPRVTYTPLITRPPRPQRSKFKQLLRLLGA